MPDSLMNEPRILTHRDKITEIETKAWLGKCDKCQRDDVLLIRQTTEAFRKSPVPEPRYAICFDCIIT